MSNENIEHSKESRPEWDHLEDWLRGQVQGLIQHVLEEEVTEFLGRAKSARRSGSDSDSGYRNGHSRSRKLTLSSGDDTSEEAEGTRHRGEVREQAVTAVRQEEQTDRRVDS